MSHLVSNIKKYLFDKGKTYSEIEDIFNYDDVVVQDAGDGAYLAEWKIEDVDKPLDADLMDNDNFEEILNSRSEIEKRITETLEEYYKKLKLNKDLN